MITAARSDECSAEGVLFMALELSGKTWKVGTTVGLGQKPREKTVDAGDLKGLEEEIRRAKSRFGLAETSKVVSCYEAGRDGFWIHRFLVSKGVESIVVDPASVQVNRRRRRAKTDRLDVRKLVTNLIRWWEGEEKVWSVVEIPEVSDEDARQFHRELETLKRERTSHTNRIKSLLACQGVRLGKVGQGFVDWLDSVRLWDGSKLPGQLRARLEREYQRFEAVTEQILVLARQRREALRVSQDKRIKKVRKLKRMKGVGENGSWLLVMELFGWREFRNRRQVGSLAGLTGTPFDSGAGDREQGIDKAGNIRVRAVMIELAWCWLRFQPDSRLSRWYQAKFGGAGKRLRKVGIVALARKLLIAFWRYVEQDVVPEGAIIQKL
jgi:transposase